MLEFVLNHENVEYPGYYADIEDCRACMVVVHGIGEHFGRYRRFGDYMAEHGVAIYGIDLPGHGKSAGIRGQTGNREEVHQIIDALLKHVKIENPGSPVFLMGHSMGGNIVLSYRLSRGKECVPTIVSSPWLQLVENGTPMHHLAIRALSLVFPNYTLNNGIKSDSLFTPSESIPSSERDPLMHSLITPKTAADCFKWANIVLKRAPEPGTPIYLMHGSADTICSVEGSRTLAARCGDECTYREWDGLKHEMLNESTWRDVAGELISWINGHIPK